LIVKSDYYPWQKKVLDVLSHQEFTDKWEFKFPEKKDEWKLIFKNDPTLDKAIQVKAL